MPPPAHTTQTASRTNTDEPADRLPVSAKMAYGFGGVNVMLGHWLYVALAMPVFNMYLGLSPTLIGTVLMIGRLTEAFVDVFVGWKSDNTRSRWGRRRPYILVGSIAGGIALPCLFLASDHWDVLAPWMQNRTFWFMLVSVVLFAPLFGMFSMPYACVGNELTPNYHERTSVMAFKTTMQKTAGVAIAGAWWFTRSIRFDPTAGEPDVLFGARVVAAIAGLIMIVAGIVCVRGVKERYYEKARIQAKTSFWRSCRDAFATRPFLMLLGIVVLVAVSTAIANDLGKYAGTYYVFGGDQDTMSQFHFLTGVGQFLFGLAGVLLANWAGKRFGKRKALLGALLVGVLAYGSSWWLYTPEYPWLMVFDTSLTVVASTGLWVLVPSMCADVVDFNELHSGKRQEGAFNSWLSWVIKFGLAFALLASGLILDATGFTALAGSEQTPQALWWIRFWLATIPVIALFVAAILLFLYPLSRTRMYALRLELESKRGQV